MITTPRLYPARLWDAHATAALSSIAVDSYSVTTGGPMPVSGDYTASIADDYSPRPVLSVWSAPGAYGTN